MLQKQINRLRRKVRVRAKIAGTKECPRLSVFRSSTHIYAQLIDDVAGVTLAHASDILVKWSLSKTERAQKVGQEIAEKAKALKLEKVVFDRGGFLYHGRVKALADSAREGGLVF